MNFIDSVISIFSPETAYRREAFRLAQDQLRAYYDAGNYIGANQNWATSNVSGEMTDRYNRDLIRARARDLERNSNIMNSLTGAYRRNIVGSGYFIQAKTGEQELNEQLEKLWRKWCKKQYCDVTGMQSFNRIVRMAVLRKKIDGGILFVKRFTSDGIVPFKLQMYEVDELDNSAMTPRTKGNTVIGGIEYNSYSKPIGYFLKRYKADGFSLAEPEYIEAKNVIFYFDKTRPSQLREISDMTSSITAIRDINEFMSAVSVKQRIEACLSVFIKRSLPTTGLGRGVNKPESRFGYEGKRLSPGMMMELNPGDDVTPINPNGQSADASEFVKLQQSIIGAGQGLSYEATSRDMSKSTYSSARQGLIEDGLTYADDKELLLEVLDEIYETFVISAVLCGAVQIPKFFDDMDEYLAHEWSQTPKAWIDPKKESDANGTALKTGQKTFKQIAAENGKDWRDQIDDMADVIEYGDEKGVDMRYIVYGLGGTNEQTDTQETDDEGYEDDEQDDEMAELQASPFAH